MRIALANSLTRSGGDGPAFAVDFLRASLDPRLTFSRASGANDVIAGVLTSAATDAPRISASTGLLIEEARTNSIRNAQAGGAVAGVVGSGGALPTNWVNIPATGLTLEVIGTGTRSGFSYVRLRLSGTPTTNAHHIAFESATQISAAPAENWTASVYLALFAGSLANITSVDIRSCEIASGVFVTADNATIAVDTTIRRGAATRTMATGTTTVQPRLRFNLTTGQPVDATFDIMAPQLELGAFVTSYITTTSAAATRAADLCSIASGSWYNAAEGTIWVEAQSGGIDTAGAAGPRLVRLRDANADNFHELRRNPVDRTLRGGTNSATFSQSSLTAEVWADNSIARCAYAWRNNDMAVCFAGNAVQTDTSSPNGMPTGINNLRLGAAASTSGFWNGYLRAVRLWPRRLSNSQLRGMTL